MCWAFLILSLTLASCTTDDPCADSGSAAPATRTPSAADTSEEATADAQTAADTAAGQTVSIDTAWAATYDYDFDGRPIGNPDSVAIALPEGSAEEGDASDSV